MSPTTKMWVGCRGWGVGVDKIGVGMGGGLETLFEFYQF